VSKRLYKNSKNQKRRMPRGKEEFIFRKYFGSELLKPLNAMSAREVEIFMKAKLERDGTFHKCSQILRYGLMGSSKVGNFEDLEIFRVRRVKHQEEE
jgi:hypothetical protein